MQEIGITALYPKPNLSKRNFKESIVPYLLRNKEVFLPNQVWSIDITYIKIGKSHQYLTAIIDKVNFCEAKREGNLGCWHSRYIVGWNLSETLDTSCVIQAVKDAIETYGTPCYINSDQGSQFTSNEYKKLLKEHKIIQSMDGKSRWADNIAF